MAEVPMKATRIDAEAAAGRMRDALEEHGIPASAGPLLLSHVWLETGRGQSMQNHNWGNITGSFQGNYWRPTWFEVDDSSSERDRRLHELMSKGQAPRAFRAYPNHDVGLHDYLNFLSTARNGAYKPIIEAAATNDPTRMAAQIQLSGYCPDCDPLKTGPTLLRLRDELAPLFPEVPKGTIEPPNAMRAVVGLAGVFGAMGALFFSLEKALLAAAGERGNSE